MLNTSSELYVKLSLTSSVYVKQRHWYVDLTCCDWLNNQNVGPNERGKFEIIGKGVNFKNNRYFHYNLYYCCVLSSKFSK